MTASRTSITRPHRAALAAVALAGGTALALAAPTAALAHVGASSDSTAPGGRAVVTFSVPHGCEGSPTRVVTIDIPEAIPAVTPTINPLWTVEKVMVPLDEPIETEYETLTERVGQVVYTAIDAPLQDGYRDTFELQLTLPEGEAGERIEFPTTQTCEVGTATWAGEDAPSVTLTDAVAADEHGAADAHADGAAEHGDKGSNELASSSTAVAAAPGDDLVARILGALGLVAGTAALTLALVRRKGATS